MTDSRNVYSRPVARQTRKLFGSGFALPEKTGTRSLFCCATARCTHFSVTNVSFLFVYACSLTFLQVSRESKSFISTQVRDCISSSLRCVKQIFDALFAYFFLSFLSLAFRTSRRSFHKNILRTGAVFICSLFRSPTMSHLIVRRRQRASRKYAENTRHKTGS
jgi:hypothetical protein